MNEKYDLLMREVFLMSTIAEQAQCVSSLMLSGRLLEDESEIIEAILQEKFRALIDTSSSIQSSIAFDFPLKNEIKAEKQTTDTQNSFAARLRLTLANSGMTQAQLADKADVSQGLVSKLVLGKAKESRKLFAIARALGVRVNWLLYGEGEMYSKQPESLESQIARLKFSGSNS